jgi:hypothetical protein
MSCPYTCVILTPPKAGEESPLPRGERTSAIGGYAFGEKVGRI